jgi:eukaryotic-like serine/threonine-protein kinase
VNATGGTPGPATKVDPAFHTSHRWPVFLPDGKHFLYLAIHHDPSRSANDALFYASLDGRENRELFRSHSNAIYADGYLLFGRGEQLMAQPFDPGSGKLSGTPVVLAKEVADDVSTWHIAASASDNGLLVLGTGGSAGWTGRENRLAASPTSSRISHSRESPHRETGLPCRWTMLRQTSGWKTSREEFAHA